MEKKKATSQLTPQLLTLGVDFDEELHAYTFQGKRCISCTQLLEKMGIKKSFKGIEHLPAVHAATQKGIRVHKEISQFLLRDVDPKKTCDETDLFIKWWIEQGLQINAMSEQIVFNKEYMVAGTLDAMWYKDKTTIIADFKTAKQVDLWQAAWQLGLYRYLFDPVGSKQVKLLVFKFDYDANTEKTYLNVEDVSHYVSRNDVQDLLEAYKQDKPYKCAELMLPNEQRTLAVKASGILQRIKEEEDAIKALKLELGEIKAKLYEVMAAKSVKGLKIRVPNQGRILALTRVDQYFRKSLDTARLKETQPQIFAEFCKLISVLPTVRISISEDNDEKDSVPDNDMLDA